jgi:hypothetical protein
MNRSFALASVLTLGLCAGSVRAQGAVVKPSETIAPSPTRVVTIQPTPQVQAVSTPAAIQVTPVAQEDVLRLKGKLGIGTDSIRVDQNSTSYTAAPGTSTYNAIDLTWWLDEKSGVDIFATYSLTNNPGADFTGATYAYPTDVIGAGIGYRRNLASPSRFLRLQALARVTAARYKSDQQMSYNSTYNLNFELGNMMEKSYNFMGGVGFEFFMPFCKSLSLQSNIVFQAGYNDCNEHFTYNPAMTTYGNTLPANGGYYKKYWKAGVLVNGFSLNTLSIHFYF